jgi:hypothetical protein
VSILSKRADVNATTQNGDFPLHLAATAGDFETVETLLQSKAEVNARDKNGRTALHICCF